MGMKIDPNINQVWNAQIKEAGSTHTQAKKVLDKTEENSKEIIRYQSNPNSGSTLNKLAAALKRLNIL